VDARIGAARAVDGYLFLSDFSEHVGDCTLNGGDTGLDLPAVECSAIVGEGQFDVTHEGEIIARRNISEEN